ncbi:MAG TPA: PIG-L family deacetylase [bacterium]|nr:PIG-L family deacetylase [bacterium]
MKKRNKVFFFSPHFDDAIFSCGGTIINHLQNGDEVSAVTVFSAIPNYKNLSKFSSNLIGLNWVESRVLENFKVLDKINVKIVNLDFLDVIFRKDDVGRDVCSSWYDVFLKNNDNYKKENNLFILIKEKVLKLLELKPNIIYFPLSIGGHVDHVVVNKISRELSLSKKNLKVYYYEDLPYANYSLKINELLNDYSIKKVEEININKKISLVSAYRVGLGIGSNSSFVISSIKEYSTKIGKNNNNFERFWILNKLYEK